MDIGFSGTLLGTTATMSYADVSEVRVSQMEVRLAGGSPHLVMGARIGESCTFIGFEPFP